MDNFTFYSPTFFDFGKDTEANVGELVKRFGGNKVLIHYGGGSIVKSGLLDRVKASLEASKIEYMELGGVKPNPRSGLVYKGIDIVKNNNIDFILAVGGGSTIDSSKAIAAGSVYDGDFWDFYSGKPIEKALPLGTILTIAAAGSEGSPNSVITKEEGMFKRGAKGDALRAKFSILNPELTMTLPPYQTACGITDIIAHLYERYLTNTSNVETTDRLIEGLIISMINEGTKVIANPYDYDARANIMWAAMLAHNNVCGVGRTQDWTSHKLEHELSALYDCAHGAGLAVCMPAVQTYTMKHNPRRFANIASRVWGVSYDENDLEKTALAGISELKKFLHSIGMPTSFAELGAKEEDIPYLAHTCVWGNNQKGIFHLFTDVDEKVASNIYKLMV